MCLALGGGIGWLIGEFRPAFPLIIVTMIFVICIDPANNLLQLAKVGSRYNRALMERKPVSINFMTQTVVWGGY